MRSSVLFVAVSILIVSFLPFASPTAIAQTPIPVLAVTVLGDTVDGATVFVPRAIIIPQVPVNLSVTFINNQAATSGVPHSFTINNAEKQRSLDSGIINGTERRILNFTINTMKNITYQGRSFEPETVANGSIRFYCIPHEAAGMVGWIILASAAGATKSLEKGINIRAYWIGMIGILAMVFWIVISYFVIKSSSPRFRDHKEHVRRGLP